LNRRLNDCVGASRAHNLLGVKFRRSEKSDVLSGLGNEYGRIEDVLERLIIL